MGLQREVTEIEMALQQHDVMIETLEGRSTGQQQSFIHKVPGNHAYQHFKQFSHNLGETRVAQKLGNLHDAR